MKQQNGTRLGASLWFPILLLGLVGQFAWTIENMYFNVFLYNTITGDPNVIATMVAASAATATLTTLLMGALSDKLGRRKVFLWGGYILWGVSTMAFGFITKQNMQALFPAASAAAMAAAAVVVLDCVMTFFGSTANDAAFNAYVTDVTNEHNRGRVESVLAALPLISMLVVFGGFDGMTQAGNWKGFFTIFGCIVSAVGVLALLFVKEPQSLKRSESGYFQNAVYGLRPSVIKNNKLLYLAFLAYMVFAAAAQVFMPYLIIYIQNYLLLDGYAIVLAVVLTVSSAVSILCGRLIDKTGKMRFSLYAGAVMCIGAVLMYFARGMVFVIVAGTVLISGFMLLSAAIGAAVRDHTPEGKAGQFQGIRMIFAVLLPMIIGPFIGAAVIQNSSATYTELGVVKQVPTPNIFLAAAAMLVLLLIPVMLYLKAQKREDVACSTH
ncbi:MAG: MFS transporter [Eubacteriales bacterium]|nr:MFS transporter [Eubacteriales bacterium]